MKDGAWDAVVIGAGHNGLTAAGVLARAGFRVLVLERREVVGGSTVTEELFPGFRFDTGTHRIGAIHPVVARQLELTRHGLDLIRPDPTAFYPLPDGRHILLWRDPARTARAIAEISPADASRWEAFAAFVARVAGLLQRVYESAPPRLPDPPPRDLGTLLRLALGLRRLGRRGMMEALRALPMSAEELVAEWFESAPVQGAVAAAGIVGMAHGPMASGTARMLFHHHVGCASGAIRPLVRPRGGVGRLADALASAARAHGTEIRLGTAVERLVTRDARVVGVTLSNGDEIRASHVLSSAGPAETFLRLLDPALLDPGFVRKVRAIRYRGATAKVHLALDGLPRFESLPETGSHLSGAITISPSVEYLERAADAAKYGQVSELPYIEAVIPSVAEPDLAPPGKHAMSVLVQYAPHDLAEGEWDDARRDALGDVTVRTLGLYAPDLPKRVLDRQVVAPPDLAQAFGLEEGHIYHGEMSLDQFFFMRPVAGWARYGTPVRGLYLCGAAAHPGGGVTCRPGYNSARQVLRAARRRA